MKPGSVVEVVIDGIGTLKTHFVDRVKALHLLLLSAETL